MENWCIHGDNRSTFGKVITMHKVLKGPFRQDPRHTERTTLYLLSKHEKKKKGLSPSKFTV